MNSFYFCIAFVASTYEFACNPGTLHVSTTQDPPELRNFYKTFIPLSPCTLDSDFSAHKSNMNYLPMAPLELQYHYEQRSCRDVQDPCLIARKQSKDSHRCVKLLNPCHYV